MVINFDIDPVQLAHFERLLVAHLASITNLDVNPEIADIDPALLSKQGKQALPHAKIMAAIKNRNALLRYILIEASECGDLAELSKPTEAIKTTPKKSLGESLQELFKENLAAD